LMLLFVFILGGNISLAMEPLSQLAPGGVEFFAKVAYSGLDTIVSATISILGLVALRRNQH